ncbi:MAG: uL14 family ribosomal protein [Candidatus Aenigmarchaeota archaeon]|nr:uL14 family ribosomal protein [Candidatus Aenigmarchaeota archaeon]
MKGISSGVVRSIQLKTRINCIDNTGSKELELVAVKGYKGKLRRLPAAGIGDVVVCSVKRGKEKTVGTLVYAVIVRQKKEYRRHDGTRVKFTDNAAVVVNPKTFDPQGTEVRTVVAREAVERFSTIGKISSIVL